jgi:hypothetical protein
MGFDSKLKDYVEVNVRIQKFYEKYPEGSIQTEIVSWENGVIVMKAYAYRTPDDPKPATGHAYEKEGSSQVNRTSALENCETSAVGRALANAGFEIKKSVASKEEVENAIHQQEQLNKQEQPKVKRADKSQYASIKTAIKAVGMNKDTFDAILADLGIEDYATMTYDQANILIEKLADYKPQEVVNQ